MTTTKDTTLNFNSVPSAVRVWLFPIVMSGLFGILKFDTQRMISDVENIKDAVITLSKNEVGYGRDIEYTKMKIHEHEAWLDELDKRIQTLEKKH